MRAGWAGGVEGRVAFGGSQDIRQSEALPQRPPLQDCCLGDFHPQLSYIVLAEIVLWEFKTRITVLPHNDDYLLIMSLTWTDCGLLR